MVSFDIKYTNDLFGLWSDFEIIKYTFTPLITTIDECIDLIEHQINRTDKNFIDRFVIM
jgi:[ribosomal protein S5]-alanine N-acetyltransferase